MSLFKSTTTAVALLAMASMASAAAPSSSSSSISPLHAPCLRLTSDHIASRATCGNAVSLAHFLHTLPDELTRRDIEACYLNAGCSPLEAPIEAAWAISYCANTQDLRRRRMDDAAPAPTPAPAPIALLLAVRQATDDNDNNSGNTDPATTAAAEKSSTSLQCIATKTQSTSTCPVQSTGPDRGKEMACVPTTVLTTRCADGLICSADGRMCMVAKNGLTTGGVIMTICFSVAIVVSMGAVTFFCCKEKRHHKRLAAKAEADAIAREEASKARSTPSGVAAAAERRADAQPLMRTGSNGNLASPASHSPVSEYPPGGNNPFSDRNRM